MPYKNPQSSEAKASANRRLRKYRSANREKINARARERTKNDPIYRQKMLDKQKKYAKKNREKVLAYKKRHNLLKNYGLSIETFNELLKTQNGGCAICGNTGIETKRLSVDHNHTTKEVRGILCNDCNFGLGNFKDNQKLLLKAIEYLKKYE